MQNLSGCDFFLIKTYGQVRKHSNLRFYQKKSHSPQVLAQVNTLPEICNPSEEKTIPLDSNSSEYMPRTFIAPRSGQDRAKNSSESFPGGIFPVRVRLDQVIIVEKTDFSEYGAMCHIRMRTNMAHAPYSHDIRSQRIWRITPLTLYFSEYGACAIFA